MAMPLGPSEDTGEPDVMVDINTTPLIDVMLVLLIMLIITIPLQTHSVNLDLPVGPPPATARQPDMVTVEVAADGAVVWNGQRLTDRAALDDRFQSVAALADQPEIHLRPHKAVPYRHVAAVLASAQSHGVAKIGIFGSP